MAQEVEDGSSQPDALNPSTGASVAIVTSAAAAIVGVLGQLVAHGSVGFAMLAGLHDPG